MNRVKPRIKDIALLAGVSIGTVDRVLHDRGEVSAGTKEKITRIVQETGYSPNVMARALKAQRNIQLISLLPEGTGINSYWKSHSRGMFTAISEMEALPVSLREMTFDLQSEEDFQNKTEIVLNEQPDGILMAPIFRSQSVAFCKKLIRKKIPFVFIDGFIENTGFLTYIGEDVYRSGRVAGYLTDLTTDSNKDILIVNITRNPGNVHHLKNRILGFLDYFKESGRNSARKIILNISEPSPDVIAKAMNRALEQNINIGAVYASGSKCHLVAGYLKEIKSDIIVTGYDLTEENERSLREGRIKFLIGQRPVEQTYIGIRYLYEFIYSNKKPEKYIYLPIDIITPENIDFFRQREMIRN
jgi:LacI family transcriptional regulator